MVLWIAFQYMRLEEAPVSINPSKPGHSVFSFIWEFTGMKLVRYGARGSEKPGLLDKDGILRDLSAVVSRHRSANFIAGNACPHR